MFLVTGGVILTLALLIGRPVQAPDWLRENIETRIAGMMRGGGILDLGGIEVTLDRGLTPTVRLSNLTIHEPGGARLGDLADTRVVLSRAALLQGDVQVKTVELSGLQVAVRRAADGTFDLALARDGQTVDSAASIGGLLSTIDAVFQQPQHASIERISAEALTLRYEDARSGRRWVADGGRLLLTQESDTVRIRTDFAVLGGGTEVASLVMTYESQKGEAAAQIGVTVENARARDIAVQSPALAWLEVLEAPLSGSMRFGINEDASLGQLFGTLEIGEGALQPTAETRPIPFDAASAYFTYDPTEELIRFDQVAVESEEVTALAEGHAYLSDFESGLPDTLLAQFSFTEFAMNPDGIFETPLAFDQAAFDFRLRLTPFAMDIGQFVLLPKGRKMIGSGKVLADEDGWDIALDARMGQITAAEIMEQWPLDLRPNTRRWFAENIISMDLSDVNGGIRLGPDGQPRYSLSFDYSGADVRYLRRLPPVRDGRGHGTLENERFTLVADQGYVAAPQGGRIDIAGSVMEVPDLRIKDPPARFTLATDSTITAGLSLLDMKPFEFLTKAGRPVNLADGRMQLEVGLGLPLAKEVTIDQVAYDVRGTTGSMRSDQIIPGRTLASAGLEIMATPEGMSISGPARVGRVPITATWSRALGEGSDPTGQVEGTMELSERFADEFGLSLPAGTLSGAGQAEFTVTLPRDAPPSFTLASDLSGVGLRIPSLDWGLAQPQTGALEVAGVLAAPARIDRLILSGAGLAAEGSVELREDGGLAAARFSRVELAGWLDAPVVLRGRGRGQPPAIELTGGSFDLRRARFQGGGEQAGPLTAVLDRLVVSDGITLREFRGNFSGTGGFNGTFTAAVNGGAQVRGTLVSVANGTAVRIRSNDAGGTLRSAGLLRQARGGNMDLILQPTGRPGSYDGQLEITNTRIQDAPALASILNAVSIVGLLDQMAVGGILFSTVEARFRLTPSQVIVQQSSAVGPSMGLSMDGIFNLEEDTLDLQGVLSPVYMVNVLGSVFSPRPGEGLIGFNFTVRGPTSAARVAVNPLSVFTPGMFREIFRRPPPQVTQ